MTKTKLCVRADASAQIGTGHIFRCLAVTDELRRQGGEIAFVCTDTPGHLAGLLEERDYSVHLISQERDPLKDAQATREALSSYGPFDWLWVDHYDLDSQWEKAARGIAARMIATDDLIDRPHDVDMLLDYTNPKESAGLYDDLIPSETRRLIGQDYVLLRREFFEMAPFTRTYGDVKRILVTMGGNDPIAMTDRILDVFEAEDLSHFALDVTVGLSNPRRQALIERSQAVGNVTMHLQHPRPSELMETADLCIGAGGMTSWERCFLGLPTLAITLADNQVAFMAQLEDHGVLRNLGFGTELTVDRLEDAVRKAIADRDWREQSGQRAQSLVDGHGVFRVLQAIIQET